MFLTQSLFTLFQLVLCCPTSSFPGSRFLMGWPSNGCDNPPMLLLGYDSRRQQVKERMPAIDAKKDSCLMQYTPPVNLPSLVICPNPSPHSWLSSLKHSHPHPDPSGFLFFFRSVPKVHSNQISPCGGKGVGTWTHQSTSSQGKPWSRWALCEIAPSSIPPFLISLSEKSCLSIFPSFSLHSSLYPWVFLPSPFCPH